MILKIDSTNREKITVSLDDTKIIEEQKLGSQVLLPLIVKILKKQKATFADISEIKVNIGPGSFTGTRVGVAVANALGFALNIPVNGKKGKIALPKYEKSKFD
ncbi:MAG: tRNA (adenosine(37)-N6)-threonylcarbamoyltransferase complex dimerization subunit type 1 TsaB [Candidatus Curtissbacteria bacterium]|nr:tRNA (adenosine(37)-N6)-threonylcarbamoyltransferase complex dimerization subunit type 1 TsaB [Candidatus Curtissbacteria bacterium]